jgi:glycosyltransferase involved in cell wall biosynthesis
LIITYYWPPCGGPGALRPVKFVKFLPHFGIQPIVLTRKTIAYHSYDNDLVHDVKAVQVMKTESLDPARLFYLCGMRIYQPKTWHMSIKHAMNFPDNKIGWIPFAYAAGMRIECDSIFVTAPPFSAFISAYAIAERTSKPLILDFRDAWLEFPFMPYKGKRQKQFVSYWERKIATFSSAITVVNENIRDSLIKKYPHIAEKIEVIPNGYDPDDFVAVQKPNTFTIAYLGTIREERNPQSFLKAVDELIHKNKIGKTDLKIKFIGHIEDRYLSTIKKYEFVEMKGHIPYHEAIREFSSSHLAIMITTGSKYFFPSRQNEYLATGLPIIVCGKSEGIRLLEQAFHRGYPGWVFDYHDIHSIENKIFSLYQYFKRGKSIVGKTPYKEFTRENLTKKLTEIIRKQTRRKE